MHPFSSIRRSCVACLVAAAFAALGPAARADQATLRIGDQRGGVKTVIEASGALAGASYGVEWHLFPAAAPLLEALNADALDLGTVGDAPFIFAVAAGAPIKAIVAYRTDASSTAIVVPASSPIHTAAGLRGYRVGTVRGSIGHYLALKSAAVAGLPRDALKLVFLSPADARAALASGSIDAWSTWGAYTAMAKLDDGDRVVADGHGIMSGLGYQVATDKAIAGKRDLLSDFVERLATARRWGIAHPDAYARAWAAETGLSVAVALETLRTQNVPASAIDEAVVADQQATADFYADSGVLPVRLDVGPAFDRSFSGPLRAGG